MRIDMAAPRNYVSNMATNASRLDLIDQQTRALAQTIQESVAELAAQIAALNERYRGLTGTDIAQVEVSGVNGTGRRGVGRPPNRQSGQGRSTESGSATAGKVGKSKRRIRRNAQQLKEQANAILSFIKKGGPEGVKGSAIRAEFGTILPSIKEFVKLYSGQTVKTKGQKAGMTYHGE